MPLPLEFAALRPWHHSPGSAVLVPPGDEVSARLWLSESVGNDAVQSQLRGVARELAEGTDLSGLDQHQLVALLTPWVANAWLCDEAASSQTMSYRLVPVAAPAAAPATAAPAPASPRPAAAAAAAAPADPVASTFAANLDVEAMVAVLRAAAQAGVPFCEECARATARQQVAEATAA